MSHQATLTLNTPRPGNQGFIMSPMSSHVTMSHHAPVPAWQCHTMSHQATLTSNTPRPGNQGFIMSPMSPHVTMSHHAPVPAWQCHTMSHQATMTSNTPSIVVVCLSVCLCSSAMSLKWHANFKYIGIQLDMSQLGANNDHT